MGSATGSSLSTDLLIDGVHTITATITDFLGNVVVDTITVTVSDTVPTVSITSSIDGATFASGASVDFSGTADDAEDGDISATIVWTSDQQPGSSFTGAGFSTNLLSDGVHVITATVTDALGNVAADSVSITVGP